MMLLIRFQTVGGFPVWVNPAHITCVQGRSDGRTVIALVGVPVVVTTNPLTVVLDKLQAPEPEERLEVSG
jgi:hypothetical protein